MHVKLTFEVEAALKTNAPPTPEQVEALVEKAKEKLLDAACDHPNDWTMFGDSNSYRSKGGSAKLVGVLT